MSLLREMHHGVGLPIIKQIQKPLIVNRDVEVVEYNFEAGDFLPRTQTFAHGADWRQRFAFQFYVDIASRQIVHDSHFVTEIGQV